MHSLHSSSNLESKNVSLHLPFSDRMYGYECCDRLLLQILCDFHSLTRPASAFHINSQMSCHSSKQRLNFKPGRSIFNMPVCP